jgi:UDPglucose 6-dehydrogenase
MRVGVIGTGYVGLVTGTCFADMGNDVVCVDIDADKVRKMKSGVVPIHEPGLDDMFVRNLKAGRLKITTRLNDAVKDTDVIFLALPTPMDEDGSADLSYVLKAARDIGPLLNQYTVIVNKSTVPVGTVARVTKVIKEGTRQKFDVLSNPEFLREGKAVEDFMAPDRIVIGTDSERARDIMETLYEQFVRNRNPIDFVQPASAEIGKYASNAFLATKISFANFVALFCEKYGGDVEEVTRIMGDDHRIGHAFLHAGLGWGGSCFPKDTEAFAHMARKAGLNADMIESSQELNQSMRRHLVDKIKAFYGGNIKGKRFAMWGLAFKENTDDIREAPAIDVVRDLTAAGATVTAYDPAAMTRVRKEHSDIKGLTFGDAKEEVVIGADALIIATLWNEFRSINFKVLNKLLKKPVIFDGRNVFPGMETLQQEGFYYESIGRLPVDGRPKSKVPARSQAKPSATSKAKTTAKAR